MKKNPIVTEFVQKLNDDRLYYLLDFVFKSKPAGYLPDLCDILGDEIDIDHWLKSSLTCEEFFEKIDIIEAAVFLEVASRETYRSQKDKDKKKSA